jgi:heat-inducible transcriptional repressor
VLVVLAVQSGAVRSVVLEIPAEIPAGLFEYVASMLNERLHGRTLAEVRKWCDARLNMADAPEASIIRMILCAPRLLDAGGNADTVFVSGATNVLRHPEFQQAERLQTIMELIDDDGAVQGVLRELDTHRSGAAVTIGAEHTDNRLRGCSTIAAEFQWGDVAGRLSVLGPTRLEYDRLAPLVAFVAHSLSTPRL